MKIFVIAALIVTTLIGVDLFWVSHCYTKPFEDIARGDGETHITALFGKPKYTANWPNKMKETWDGEDAFTTAGSEIVKSFCYWSPLGIGGHYCVRFDVNGRVVAKSRPPKL